jgi:hypothetical protein
MGMWNKSGATNKGLLTMALAMALGPMKSAAQEDGLSVTELGERMAWRIRNHYRSLSSRTPRTNAATFKRASTKRKNIAKHCRAARGH